MADVPISESIVYMAGKLPQMWVPGGLAISSKEAHLSEGPENSVFIYRWAEGDVSVREEKKTKVKHERVERELVEELHAACAARVDQENIIKAARLRIIEIETAMSGAIARSSVPNTLAMHQAKMLIKHPQLAVTPIYIKHESKDATIALVYALVDGSVIVRMLRSGATSVMLPVADIAAFIKAHS